MYNQYEWILSRRGSASELVCCSMFALRSLLGCNAKYSHQRYSFNPLQPTNEIIMWISFFPCKYLRGRVCYCVECTAYWMCWMRMCYCSRTHTNDSPRNSRTSRRICWKWWVLSSILWADYIIHCISLIHINYIGHETWWKCFTFMQSNVSVWQRQFSCIFAVWLCHRFLHRNVIDAIERKWKWREISIKSRQRKTETENI